MTYGGEQYDPTRGERVMRIKNTAPDARTVLCNDCGTQQRWGCAECAEHWADFHRNEFNHNVVVFPPRRDSDMNRPRRRRQWWETR